MYQHPGLAHPLTHYLLLVCYSARVSGICTAGRASLGEGGYCTTGSSRTAVDIRCTSIYQGCALFLDAAMTRTDVNPRFLLVRHVGIIEILADALPKWGDVLTCNPLQQINLTIGKFVAAGQSLQTVCSRCCRSSEPPTRNGSRSRNSARSLGASL